MPSLMAHIYNTVMRWMPPCEGDIEAQRRRNDRKPPKPPKDISVTHMDLGGLAAERIEKPGNLKGWVLYVHGGGFTTGSARERRELCQYIADKHGYNCISINYRLAPENKWPAQLEDCETAWRSMLDMGFAPNNTVLMGESAGGTLVLSLALLLKEKHLPQPKAIAAFSPGTNNAEHYPSHTENAKTDYMLRDQIAKGIGEPVFGKDAPQELLRKPTISPIYGEYSGLPPIFLAVSDTEALYDDSTMLYNKLRDSGHPVELDVQHGVCHAYPMFPMIPEARATLKRMFSFVDKGQLSSY